AHMIKILEAEVTMNKDKSDGFEIFTDDKDNDEYDKDDKDATDMCLLIIMDMEQKKNLEDKSRVRKRNLEKHPTDKRTLSIDESVDDIVGRKRSYSLDRFDNKDFHDLYEDIEEVEKYKVKKNVISDYFTPVIVDVDSEVSPVDQPKSK
ncbi:11632_t:CDS:2, partial [Funneliformis caledonium]